MGVQLQGTIIEAKGEQRWLVRFDNGLEKECPMASLKMLGDPRYNRASVTSAPIFYQLQLLLLMMLWLPLLWLWLLLLMMLWLLLLRLPLHQLLLLLLTMLQLHLKPLQTAFQKSSSSIFLNWCKKHQFGSLQQPVFHHKIFKKRC
jgi:hypothetical protein